MASKIVMAVVVTAVVVAAGAHSTSIPTPPSTLAPKHLAVGETVISLASPLHPY